MTTRYSKRIPSPLDGLTAEDLMEALSEFLLQSGFDSPYDGNGLQDRFEGLRRAILEKLVEMGRIPQSSVEKWLEDRTQGEGKQLDQLLDEVIQQLLDEGWIKPADPAAAGAGDGPSSVGPPAGSARFEITDRSLDFLGFRTLRHLLGSIGKSSFGRHETKELSTGVEACEAGKDYEFGDTLNLDTSETLLRAIGRSQPQGPIDFEYSDLVVRQTQFESSCATVLLLDTSHSMILYGEDRFTPAKRVALALAHLIRSQYPGDSLRLALFHDSAEEVPLKKLASVQVGPYHTNTCEGFRLARRILASERKEMKQIVMITDGKPSAITLPNGQIYKNAFGLDSMIIGETFKEVAACRKSGILINTFMVASDPYLIEFVKKVTEISRGKAYFTSTLDLGQYVLMDYARKKTERVH